MKNTFTFPILAQKYSIVNMFFEYFLCENVCLNILNILYKFHKKVRFLKIIFIFSPFLKFMMKI